MMLSWVPENWGKKYATSDGGVAYTHTGPNSISCITNAHYFITFFSALPNRTRALNSDQKQAILSPAGSFETIPQSSDLYSSWSQTKESLLIALMPERLKTIAKLEHENDLFELHQIGIGIVDKEALLLSQKIKHELLHQDIGYGESLDALLTLLGIHVLRSYSNLGEKPAKSRGGGLSPKTWSRISDYIHANLDQKLIIEKMAEVACLSPSHFLRAFKETSGETPHQYILKARLSTAKGLMLTTEASFDEVARISGFASNSHMSTSIKKAWGVTPSQLRKTLKGQP